MKQKHIDMWQEIVDYVKETSWKDLQELQVFAKCDNEDFGKHLKREALWGDDPVWRAHKWHCWACASVQMNDFGYVYCETCPVIEKIGECGKTDSFWCKLDIAESKERLIELCELIRDAWEGE